ncbi:hypothetical protein SOVF_096520 [Spinacia oleracea]|nr:hypothetical protein SOVF_096520 [Spinacia oleracea]
MASGTFFDLRIHLLCDALNGAKDLTDATLQDGYRDMLKLAENVAAFNQLLKYAHFCPFFSVKSDPRSWWKYAYKAVSDQMKKARFGIFIPFSFLFRLVALCFSSNFTFVILLLVLDLSFLWFCSIHHILFPSYSIFI